MATQNASTVAVRYKRQSAKGSPANGSGATGLRLSPSQSMGGPDMPVIANDEIRSDEQRSRGQLGSRSGTTAYSGNFSVGTWDDIMEAIARGTFDASADITEADVTSITTTASTIVAASGSWITEGVEAGDFVKLTNHATAGNNGRWFPVLSVTATTITTLAGLLTLNATPDTAFTLTRAKRVNMGIEKYYYSVEELLEDISGSLYLTDAMVCKVDLSANANENVKIAPTWMGLDIQPLDSTTSPTSPVFTSPSYTTTDPVRMANGIILLNGAVSCLLTGMQFSIDRGGQPIATLCDTANDVSMSPANVTGTLTMLMEDMSIVKSYSNNDVLDLLVQMRDENVDTADFGAIWMGNIQLGKPTAQIAQEGLRSMSVPFTASIDLAGSGRPQSTLKYISSAA
jgi:hypothetical protein